MPARQAGQGIGQTTAYLFGRKIHEHMTAHWPHEPSDNPIGASLNATPKYVATTTMHRQDVKWANCHLASQEAGAAGPSSRDLSTGRLTRSRRPTAPVAYHGPVDECLQGWCTDPFERHEARWMSEGVPTALVRDGDVEAQDPPPDEPFKVAPVRVGIGGGVVDADERDTAHAPERAADAAWDAFGQTMS